LFQQTPNWITNPTSETLTINVGWIAHKRFVSFRATGRFLDFGKKFSR
jgi:hypothetical protein